MSSSKLHPSLPAPVVHSSHLPASHSKSSVLAGVQDAYWSDDEGEDAECPLCLEEMDVSDLNFKPCPCGYQVCRFCWHHIKENLNRRCPACRREYSDEAVQFKSISKEDHKKLTQQKKQRDRDRKELDALGRRHLLNVRVVQRNVVYIVGLGPRFAKEELIPTLRSNEYFGQYGKITKILLVKRTSAAGDRTPVVGLYITYYRREDAARAISIVDGTASPSGGGDVMRASYGTTKYCIAFLRGVSCTSHGCMDLHDWGDEKDCFTKEDLTTLKHTIKDTETRQRGGGAGRRRDDTDGGLPRAAGWGKSAAGSSALASTNATASRQEGSHRSTRRGHRSSRSGAGLLDNNRNQTSTSKQHQQERKQLSAKAPSQPSSSRPPTPAATVALPARPTTPSSNRQTRSRKEPVAQPPLPPRSPASSVALESDSGSGSLDAASASPALSPPSVQVLPVLSAPPGLPIVPPGLSAAQPSANETATVPQALSREPSSANSYQMSTQAQALMDDVMLRRESVNISSFSFSPFPDLDRTLQSLSGAGGEHGGFNFNMDPKLAMDDDQFSGTLDGFETETAHTLSGINFNPFPVADQGTYSPPATSSTFGPPPGLTTSANSSKLSFDSVSFNASVLERQTSSSSGYAGMFNPFAESNEVPAQSPIQRPTSTLNDDTTRRKSRFGFARERQGSGLSTTSSPMLSADASLASFSEGSPSASSITAPWPFQRSEFGPPPGLPARTSTPGSRGSPLVPYAAPQSSFPHQPSRFQPFDMGPNETSLREMLGIGRERSNSTRASAYDSQQASRPAPSAPFHDPAIMTSVAYGAPGAFESGYALSAGPEDRYSPQLAYSMPAPPGSFQQTQQQPIVTPLQSPVTQSFPMGQGMSSASPMQEGFIDPAIHPSFERESPRPSPVLSPADFPALPTSTLETVPRVSQAQQPHIHPSAVREEKAQIKADRKVTKKAVVADKAAEKDRAAKAKAAEKERLAKVKAEEKERLQRERLEKERLAKDRIEKERQAKDKAEKDKIAAAASAAADRQRDSSAAASSSAAQAKVKSQARAEAGTAEAKQTANSTSGPATSKPTARSGSGKAGSSTSGSVVEAPSPLPILSKMPKKSKPTTKPIKIPRDDGEAAQDTQSTLNSAVTTNSETPQIPPAKLPVVPEVMQGAESGSVVGRSSRDPANTAPSSVPKTVGELLQEIDDTKNGIDMAFHPFLDAHRISPAASMPADYSKLVKTLSALPVDGGDPAQLSDKTVASFQQLLETMTQTMAELVQKLPQTTWGSVFKVLNQDVKDLTKSISSFDGLLHDDLQDLGADEEFDGLGPLPPTMDKRAKWMEEQLVKLEELHRDVNAAAVRGILSSNDRGWDRAGYLPRVGNSLSRFQHLGMVEEGGATRPMTAEELEKKLVVAKEAAAFAEAEVREAMEAIRALLPAGM